jgi:hypothetical protein
VAGRDLECLCPICELVKILDGQAVLGPAELCLGQPEPVGYQFLGERARAMVRVVPVGADDLADMPGRQGFAHETGVPEAGREIWGPQREGEGLPLAGRALGQAVATG